MADAPRTGGHVTSLTGLLLPLADRHLLLPNVAVAELIDYQDSAAGADAPQWFLGPVRWRDRVLPLVCFEAACGERTRVGGRARIVVLNALGGLSDMRHFALLTQGIPRSCKLDSQLSYVDVPLDALELAAVQVGETVAWIPDLMALETLLRDHGIIDLMKTTVHR